MELIYLRREKVLHVVVKPDEYAAMEQALKPALFARRNERGCVLVGKLAEQVHKHKAKDGPTVQVKMMIEA